jgi:hypothetical protein
MKKAGGLLLMCFVLAIAYAGNAYACSCAEPTLHEEVEERAAIFTGKVVKLEVVGVKEGVSTIEATVQRIRAFKGYVPETVVLTTSDGCCYCQGWYDISRTYVFFAYESEGKLATSACSRTKLIDDAKEELQYLEQWSGSRAKGN